MVKMTIGRVAQQAGVSVETIRFYERRRLLEQPLKSVEGGYRVYPNHAAHRIRFVKLAQELGSSLREAEELLSLRANATSDCADVRERTESKLAEVDGKIVRLG